MHSTSKWVKLFGSLVLATSLIACGPADQPAGSATAAQTQTGRYLIKFKPGLAGQGKSAVTAAGATVVLDLTARHDAVAAHVPAVAVQGLQNNPNIEYIEEDAPRYPLAQSVPYGIPLIQADLVDDSMASNRTICIIDSGIDLGHPDLPDLNVHGTNVSGTGYWYEDTCGHGSHVAGTIAAINNTTGVVGVLPNGVVNLHIVKVFDGPECGWAFASGLVSALDKCLDAGANIVSMSLGGSFKSKTEDKAFAQAFAAGVLPIAAAGNDGTTRKSYPASYESVISVAAVDENKQVADFSQKNSAVELSAAGVAVTSTVPRGTGSETSVTVAGTGYAAAEMDGSPHGSANGLLVNCGLGDAPCAGATGAVCLIQRGNISFADKVLNCQAGGGIAAVIYNNEPGVLYGTLGGVATDIPSVGISQADGATLLAQAGATATVTLDASDYGTWDGTSMATPHVSGVAALIWSHFTSCTNAQVRDALTATAEDLGAAGRDDAYGFGLVQAEAAIILLSNNCGGGGTTPDPDFCGDGSCSGSETCSTCSIDCGSCGSCKALSDSCSSSSDCCSGKCHPKKGYCI
jgi:serine protease